MTFVDGFKAAVSVSLIFSWIALLIALLPTLLVTIATETRRWHSGIAGLLGGVVGGFSGAASLFLSFFGLLAEGRFKDATLHKETWGCLSLFPSGPFSAVSLHCCVCASTQVLAPSGIGLMRLLLNSRSVPG